MATEANYWLRNARRQVSRRRVLATGAAGSAGALALGLVGCGDDDDDDDAQPTGTASAGNGSASATATQGAGEPRQGGEIVYSQSSNTQTLDPHTTLSRAWNFTAFYSDKLVSPDRASLEPIQGDLIETWEQTDDTTLLLNVRPGVTYHEGKVTDGRAFTAEDAAYNLMRIAGRFDEDRIAQFQRSTTLANMDMAAAVDDATVQVTFTAPNSQFLNGMADWRNWLVARENIEADPNFTDMTAQAGTGPFIIESWDSASEVGTYVRNPNYWRGPAHLDGVRQVNLPDAAASRAAFLAGDIGFVRAQETEVRNAIADGVDSGQFVLHVWEHVGWEYFRLNQNIAPFDNPDVRRAIFLVLNPTELLNVNYGDESFWDYSGPLVSGMPGAWTSDEVRQMPGWNPDTKDADIADAMALMDAAGYPDGEFEFTLVPNPTGPWNNNAHIGKDQLNAVWPGMTINIVGDGDSANFARNLGGGNYDAITYASFPPPSALVEGSLHYRTAGGRNYTQYSNPAIDAIFDAALAELDTDARNELIGELQQAIMDDVFIAPLGKAREAQAHQGNIKGFAEWGLGPGSFAAYNPVFSASALWIEEDA